MADSLERLNLLPALVRARTAFIQSTRPIFRRRTLQRFLRQDPDIKHELNDQLNPLVGALENDIYGPFQGASETLLRRDEEFRITGEQYLANYKGGYPGYNGWRVLLDTGY